MSPSDEQLLHRFYAGQTDALDVLAGRYDPILARIAYQILLVRAGSAAQATEEWDVNDRLNAVWTIVVLSRRANVGRWPHQRISARPGLSTCCARRWIDGSGCGRRFRNCEEFRSWPRSKIRCGQYQTGGQI